MSIKTKISLGLISFVVVVASVIGGLAIASTTRVAIASGPSQITAVFRGDTLHDLARLLRPMTYAVPAGPPGIKTLNLRDAIYIGTAGGRARLLTVWLGQDVGDDSMLLLSSSDVTKPPTDIADALAQGPLAGSTFAVIPVEIAWENWSLRVTRIGTSIVKGPTATSAQVLTAITTASPMLKQVDTRSVSIPIGFGLTKLSTWQPWFNADSVVIEIKPAPVGDVSTSPPNITGLSGNSGFLVGDAFLNNVFSNELKDRFVGTKVDQGSYHAQDLQFVAQDEKLIVSGRYIEQAPPATVRMQAEFGGEDLAPVSISQSTIDCKTLPPLQCAQVRGQVIATGILLTNKIKPNITIRPPDEQNLGNFFIGSKPLTGIARVDKLQAVNGSVVVVCTVRLMGGHIS